MSLKTTTYKQKDQIPFEYESSDLEKHLKLLLKELYSTLMCVDYLEQLHTNTEGPLIDAKTYSEKLNAFFAKYDTLLEEIFPLAPQFLVEDFLAKYDLRFKCYKGIRRLSHRRVSQQGEAAKSKASEAVIVNSNAKLISEVTGNFITLMDALNLNYDKKHQIHPLLSKLVLNLNKVFSAFNKITSKEEILERMGDFKQNREKLVEWMITLNGMEASSSLGADSLKQLLLDLEAAYNRFYDLLE